MRRAARVALVALALCVVAGAGQASGASRPPALGDVIHDLSVGSPQDVFDALARWGGAGVAAQAGGPGVGVAVLAPREWEYLNAVACMETSARWVPGPCADGVPQAQALDCAGQEWVEPRWRRYRVPPSQVWSVWQQVDYGSCGQVPRPAMSVEDFRRLALPAPVLHVQPDRGWVLVNAETIVFTDASPVVLVTDLFGYGVEVEATPWRFTYGWGDGHETVTRDPGAPYPALDVFHEYEQLGTVAVTLSTEWTGRYRFVGEQQWFDVTGTAVTSTTGAPFEVQERVARLVSETCDEDPDAWGCGGWGDRQDDD